MTKATRSRKLIIVSNRLPFDVSVAHGVIRFSETTGGLVTGLSTYLDCIDAGKGPVSDYVWIGWPGATVPEEHQSAVRDEARSRHRSVPVFLSTEEMNLFYFGFCNKTLWPLFHYFPSYTSYESDAWTQYRQVNERFAETVADVCEPGDLVWIHDYHLLLLPAMVRALRPGASISFFLHIPFPSYEVYRLLPRRWRRDILEGMLGADLIGFHTYEYTQHFLQSVLRILDVDHNLGMLTLPTHLVQAQAFPMGIDFEKFRSATSDPCVVEEARETKQSLRGAKVILSVDRLDYSKGILHRLEGFEILLGQDPSLHGNIVLLMVVVPSRVAVDQYRKMKRQIEEAVGRINGQFGRAGWTPVIYQYRYLPFQPLAALYSIGDVALVTPLRDGMNLVAKEYVASRADGTGVLIISETAGAAKELGEAIVINPNNREEIAEAMRDALAVPPEEQRRRMLTMQQRLRRYTVHRWANEIIRRLEEQKEAGRKHFVRLLPDAVARRMEAEQQASGSSLFLFDYDGTLVPLVERPELARPSQDTLRLLEQLGKETKNTIVLVSGRDRKTMEDWFGSAPVDLVAEHGSWMKRRNREWRRMDGSRIDWKKSILPIMEWYSDSLPNSFIEEKDSALVWHYRTADPEQSEELVGDLTTHLVSFTASSHIQVLRGHKVLEVRSADTNKGASVQRWLRKHRYEFILAIGDDETDEDLFKALPPQAYTIRVGIAQSNARYNLRDVQDVRRLLDRLITRDPDR